MCNTKQIHVYCVQCIAVKQGSMTQSTYKWRLVYNKVRVPLYNAHEKVRIICDN